MPCVCKLVTKAPFSIGKPQLRPPRCDTRVTPEEKRSFLARRAQETEQRRALFNAETDAETTLVRFQNYFMNSFHFRRGWKYYASCPLHTILFTILTCAQRTRVHFCPQHWLLCHLGLYQFEFEPVLSPTRELRGCEECLRESQGGIECSISVSVLAMINTKTRYINRKTRNFDKQNP